MSTVRNCQELGENLKLIVQRLLANDNLVNLLYYTDKDPLSQPPLSQQEKEEKIFGKLIKIVPIVGPKENSQSILTIRIVNSRPNYVNNEFKDVTISVESFVPLTQWVIKNSNLRPFAIMGEIEKSLKDKTINGLGKMADGGFSLSFLTEEISCYEQDFYLTEYD